MTIDPRWAVGLTLFIAILNFLSGATTSFTDLGLSPVDVKHLMAAINLAAGILGIIATVLTGIPSKDNKTGFIVKGPDKPVS